MISTTLSGVIAQVVEILAGPLFVMALLVLVLRLAEDTARRQR